MPDDQITAELMALTVEVAQPVPVTQVMTYLRENGLWLPIKAAAAGTSQGAETAVDFNDDLRNMNPRHGAANRRRNARWPGGESLFVSGAGGCDQRHGNG
jgi:hypothetical protein